ncbi:autotransporter domain-containing protein [Sphingomonas sp. LaA6.9]|uniref:autotransporter domain-containing protein n=1 Tax=Sphingomonas sp. LaA6.9 TaxID=2919914 RepID=UPI001F4F2A70|nr:autotransporter domain-containing protein [Sphingomonas sp. LaA6.9]MCJ8159818.1 autotransporter domain-containing protein [Sphingomonas sp. LaA6.9]
MVVGATIQGGNGGAGGTGAGGTAPHGSGGAGIVGGNLNITLDSAGAIAGGFTGGQIGNEAFRANAITFTGGNNALTSDSATPNILGNIAIDGGSLALVQNGNDITLSNQITGNGSLIKAGSATVSLTGTNTYSGGTTLLAGTLHLGNNNAIGTGGLTVNGAASLTGAAGLVLNRAITLNNTLNFGAGGGALTITGVISGAGGLSLSGASGLTLNAANTFGGGFNLGGGSLIVGHNTALGTGNLTVNGASTLGASTAVSLTNNVNLNAGLSIGGSSNVALNGSVNGAGGITKNGAANLTLGGANTFLGGVSLQAGSLTLGSNTALGLSLLTVGGAATLNASAGINLGNAVSLNANLGIGGSNDIALGGFISGPGALSFSGSGTLALNGNNIFGGGLNLLSGTLSVGNNGALGLGNLNVSGNASLRAGVPGVSLTNTINLAGGTRLSLTGTNALVLNSTISGIGGLAITSGAVTLGGSNIFGGGVELGGASLTLASNSGLGTGALDVTGAATLLGSWNNLGNAISLGSGAALNLGNAANQTLSGIIGGAGALAKNGTGTLTLTGNNFYSGGTTVNAGTLQIGNGGVSGTIIGNVTNDATIAFNSSTSSTYSGAISGTGALIKDGTGTLTLTGTHGYTGTTTINSGTLRVNGALASGAVIVNSGATIGGSGIIGGAVTIDNGGTLSAGNSPGTLTLGLLNLNAGSIANFELNAPGVIGGTGAGGNDLVNVTGDLTLGGTLNAQASAAGYYRLFNYGGALAGSFATVNTSGSSFVVDQARVETAIPGQVNLAILGAGQNMQFWDGIDAIGNGSVDGGAGTWSSAATNWTGQPGQAGVNSQWDHSVGVFTGTAGGTVTVQGAQSFDTLQFSTSGYQLTGGTLGFDPAAGSAATIQVDNAISATIASGLTNGASGTALRKTGTGTLILSGANTHSGGTILQGGTLQVGADGNLGDGLGGIVFEGGTLAATNSFLTGRSIALNLDGRFDTAAGTTLTAAGMISGSGSLIKAGLGTLVLSGSNSYAGDTIVEAGTLIGNRDTIRGAVSNAGVVVFDQASDDSFAGNILGLNGARGVATKRGVGMLTLTGNSANDWVIEQGQLETAASRFMGNAQIASGASLGFLDTGAASYAAVLSGSGDLHQYGSAHLTLTGNSAGFTGTTTVHGGTLRVDGALGGSVAIGTGASLEGSGRIGMVNVSGFGALIGRAGDTLGMVSLTLGNDANVVALLGTPSANALFDVTGDLVLDGRLSVTDAGGFGAGVYRLFDYGGTLIDNGLELNLLPSGISANDLQIQTAIAGRVNLISSAGVDLLFWDGTNAALHDNGVVDGGAGTWTATGRAWTDANGLVNGAVKPKPGFAVFQGTGGVVTLDDSAGALSVAGLQFASHGYSLAGDALSLGGTGGRTVIRVGDGSAAGAAMTATIASALTGTGDLVKADRGTLILTGANAYTGNTIVEGGTLIGNAASIRGNIANAGTLVFDQAGDAGFGGAIAGSGGVDGAMVKRGAGSLTLGGTSSLDWSIEQGSLVTSTQRFTGDATIAAGATLLFNQTEAGSYAGTLGGTGTLAIDGGQRVELTGNNAGFAGAFDVRRGTLIASGTLGGATRIGNGALVGGDGSLGSTVVAAGGMISPGNSIGTLNVNGDIIFEAGSIYAVEVDATGDASDRIVVSGRAILNGGEVAHIGFDGNYRRNASYTILTAAGGIQGQFANATSDYAFLDALLGYSASAVTLTLQRNDIDFATIGRSANQRATAAAVQALDSGNPLFEAVVMLGADQARTAFESLSGEVHASLQSVLVEDSRFIRSAALDRMRIAGAAIDAERGIAWWMQGIGNWGSLDGSANAHRIKHDAAGVLMGVDAIAAEHVQLGIYGGWQKGDADVRGLASDADIDSYHLGLYAGADTGPLSLRTGFAFGWHDADITRRISFAGFSETATSSRRSSTAQGFAEIGYRLDVAGAAIEPFASIAHVTLDSEAVQERGNVAALGIAHATMGTSFTTLGARITQSFSLGGMKADLRTIAGWRHAFGDLTPGALLAFTNGDPFSIGGTPVAKDALSADIGLALTLSSRARLDIAYAGDVAASAQNHSARATFSLNF